MPSSINSTSSSPGGLITTGDTDNLLQIKTGDTTAISIDASQNVTVTGNLIPATDNTGVVGNSANTWSNGQFTNLTVDSTLNVRAAIDLADSDILRFGSSDDWEMYHNGTGNIIDLTVGDLLIRDDGTAGDPTRFTFERTTGNLTVGGNLTVDGASGGVTTIKATTATTNAVTDVLRIDSQSSGTPAAGIGVGLEFATETAAGNTEVGAIIEAITTDVTATSEDFDLSFKTMAAGAAAAERMRVTSTGILQFDSGYGSVATAYGCRAWANLNCTTTPVTIRASGNISSITDNGVGLFVANLTNALTDADYSVCSINTIGVNPLFIVNNNGTRTSSALNFRTTNINGTNRDSDFVDLAFFR